MEKQDTEKIYTSLRDENPNQTRDINQNNSSEEKFTVTKDELEAIKEEFLAERQKLEEEKWLELNVAKFDALLLQNRNKNISVFSKNIITQLAEIFEAQTIVFFDFQQETQVLSVQASYGISIDNIEKKSYSLGEGLIGQVAKSKETFNLLQGVSQLLIYPIIFQEELQAIIEINFSNKLIPKSEILLQKILENTASATSISKTMENDTSELLKEEKITTSFEGQNAALKSEEELKIEINRLKNILVEKQSDEKVLLKRIAVQKEEVYQAEETLNNFQKNQKASTEEVSNDIITEKDAEIKQLKEDLEWKIAEIERQDSAINQKKKLLADAEQQIDKLTQENHKQVEEIVASSKGFQEIEQDMNLMRSTHKQELDNHQRTIKNLEAEIESHEEKHQQKIKEIEDNLSVSVQERIAELQNKSGELAKVEEELKQIKIEEENTRKQFEEFKLDQQKQVLEFEENIKQKDFQVEEYKKEIGNIQQVLSEKLNLEEKLKEEVNFKTDEIKQLKQSIKQKETDNSTGNSSKLAFSINGNNSQVSDINNADITSLKTRVAELEDEIVRKEQMILELSQQSNQDNSNSEVKELQDQLEQQESSFNFVQDELQKRNQENSHLEQALNEIREKLYDREKKIEELKNWQEKAKEQNNVATKNENSTKTDDSSPQNEQLEYLMWKNTAMMSFNLEAEILEVNALFAKVFEYKIEELQDQSLGMLVDREYTGTDEYKRLWYNISRGHEAQINAFKASTKNQETKELNVSFTPIWDNNGSIERVLMLVREPILSSGEPEIIEKIVEVEVEKKIDNNEESQVSQQLLHEQAEKLKAVDNSFLILELDTEGNIIAANSQFLRFLGYDLEDIQGRAHRLLIDPEDRKNENYLKILNGAQKGDFSFKTFKYIGKEGESLNLVSHFNPIKDTEGEVKTILILSQLAKYSI